MKRLILIDSHAIIYRAYHALPPMTSPKGEPTNAVYGFITILLRMVKELKPDYIAAPFDLPGQTFRHAVYEAYKAQRPETPPDLASQFLKVKEALQAFDIPVFEKEGYEADDMIGTIVKQMEKEKNIEIIIVTGDMDTLQLVGPKTKVYAMRKGISDIVIYDKKAVFERFGFSPAQMIDWKGLKGDPSDNIKGVKGIGEKTATELIQRFGSIKGIYAALKKGKAGLSPSLTEKLVSGEKDAELSRELATIATAAPITFNLEQAQWKGDIAEEKVRALCERFGFMNLLKRLGSQSVASAARVKKGGDRAPQSSAQATLLGEAAGASGFLTELNTSGDFHAFAERHNGEPLGIFLHEGKELLLITEQGKIFQINRKLFSEKKVKQFFASHHPFIAYDWKLILHFLRLQGVTSTSIVFDVMLAAYLTNIVGRDFSYLGIVVRELARMVAADPRRELAYFFEVKKTLEEKITEQHLGQILFNIEIPLSCVLAKMEERGILIDRAVLEKIALQVNQKLSLLTKQIHADAGETFNINSSQQLSRILFEILGLSVKGLRKTDKGGVVSTRESELEKLKGAHSIIEKILSYRELTKLKTTYIDVLPTLADQKTMRVHTTFNQVVTATGRLSSSDPNLQNIPIMSEYGREIRKAFIAEQGYILAAFDYSQIELRVAAHIADDQKMIEAFQKGLDIHKLTASEIYNIPLDQVTPELRRAAKTLNFGVLYGMGAQALSESTSMSRDEAKKFIDEYFHDFSGIKEYIEATKLAVEERGYVETIFGRKRYIPEIHSANWQLKREAERMAVNMPVQGTAADLVKIAMVRVDKWIEDEKIGSDVRMLLQVHDELVFEIKKESLEIMAPKIKMLMEWVAVLKVPLIVDAKVGKSWGELHPFLDKPVV